MRHDGQVPTEAERAALIAGLELMSHRGPDGHGVHRNGRVTLGHRRLSIIDLSEAGHQPMCNEAGDVWIVFNGEIYNYRELRLELIAAGHTFKSNSDTEAIVHGFEEWGMEGLLRRLRGMFAFGLHDSRNARVGGGRLFLARDRLGIKPLYYSLDKRRFVFASEARALVRGGSVTAEIDAAAVIGFLAFGSVPDPRTIWKNVRSLPAASFLSFDGREPEVRRYWELSDAPTSSPTSDLRELLEDVVDRHLIADVPVGIFLSGGVDSSSLAALAAARYSNVKTLTVTFDEDEFSEANAARDFARRFGTEHSEVRVRQSDFKSELPRILASMDQPTNDGINTYFVAQAASRAGLKVVLSGLGGDEIFYGYPHYRRYLRAAPAIQLFQSSGRWLQDRFCQVLGGYGEFAGQERFSRASTLAGRDINEGLYLLARGFFPVNEIARLVDCEEAEAFRVIEEATAAVRPHGTGPGGLNLQRIARYEFARYLHDQLLRDSDIYSMAHSVELRVPFLDHVLVERAWAVPPAQHISSQTNKPRLVEAVSDSLVEAAAKRPKQGFTFPFSRWMKAQASDLEDLAVVQSPLNAGQVRNAWRAFRMDRMHWSRAWATVALSNAVRAQ